MARPTRINTLTVEAPSGFRTINLLQGDIADSRDELLVASSHEIAGVQPTGAVITALTNRGVNFSQVEHLLQCKDGPGTMRVLAPPRLHPWQVLVVRLPGADPVHIESFGSGQGFERGLWTLFGSMAALEMRGDSYRSMSLPLLGGSRGYPPDFVVSRVLRACVEWLKASRTMERINIWLYDVDEIERAIWDAAMDEYLGRTSVAAGEGELLRMLADAARERLGSARSFGTDTEDDPIAGLDAELRANPLRPAVIGGYGRKLCEAIASRLLADANRSVDGDLFAAIRTLLDERIVTKPEGSALHTLRVLGNEASHEGGRLSDFDMAPMLAGLARALQLCRERGWR